MRTILELIRIIVLLGILGALCWTIIGNLYTTNEIARSYSWLGGVSILIWLFVLYRNKLQFSGWYKGADRKRLSRKTAVTLISVSILLLMSPFVLGKLLS